MTTDKNTSEKIDLERLEDEYFAMPMREIMGKNRSWNFLKPRIQKLLKSEREKVINKVVRRIPDGEMLILANDGSGELTQYPWELYGEPTKRFEKNKIQEYLINLLDESDE